MIKPAIKLFTKEDIVPANTNKFIFLIAPLISAIAAFAALAPVPFLPEFEVFGHTIRPILADINVGVLYIAGVAAVCVFSPLAAGLASNIAGIKKEIIRKSLSDFPGVEHRLEKVCKVAGVQYINDSKATNVDACWYALESMRTPTILIIGGKDKGNDYNAIKDLVKKKCVGLVYLGADNQKLHENFDELGIPVRDTHSMKECIEACYAMAKPGDTVLLSPCCASFDLFKNMEDRGEQFKTLARAL